MKYMVGAIEQGGIEGGREERKEGGRGGRGRGRGGGREM